jgi:hypothetical protein
MASWLRPVIEFLLHAAIVTEKIPTINTFFTFKTGASRERMDLFILMVHGFI